LSVVSSKRYRPRPWLISVFVCNDAVNIETRMDLGEVGWGDVNWIGLAKDRNRWRALVNSVLNPRVPYNSGKLSSGLLGSAQLHRVS
jgi:hypothetical protein